MRTKEIVPIVKNPHFFIFIFFIEPIIKEESAKSSRKTCAQQNASDLLSIQGAILP